jgi:hypothetical protein
LTSVKFLHYDFYYVFMGEQTMRKNDSPSTYTSRIEEIKKELKTKSLGEAERDRNISALDYTGVGFGYNLKSGYPKTIKEAFDDIKTREFDKLASRGDTSKTVYYKRMCIPSVEAVANHA